ncbi:type II toxin-antitoxin system VapC family toxin [Chloroflexi bacterium TSY]|nr:type II toxin-antitoxin system VapC family toxin [Chloroflexi bacterium TSY]
MSQPVSSFQGDSLYLDTMIFHAVLRASDEVARSLFKSIEAGEFQAYTAALTFDELAYRMLLVLIRDKYGKSPLDQLRQNRQGMVAEFYSEVETQLTQFQLLSNLIVLDITIADLTAMHQNCAQYYLLPRDSLHLAAMQKVGYTALVSLDSDFDRVEGIQRYVLA